MVEFPDSAIITVGIFIFGATAGLFTWLYKMTVCSNQRSWRTMKAVALFLKLEIQLKKEIHPEVADRLKDIEESVDSILDEKKS